ncbi:hypothetical protein ACP4OV_006626 [Aristida adscensionis]
MNGGSNTVQIKARTPRQWVGSDHGQGAAAAAGSAPGPGEEIACRAKGDTTGARVDWLSRSQADGQAARPGRVEALHAAAAPSRRPAFRPSPSPEPPAEELAVRAEPRRGGDGKRKKALYLVVQEQGHGGAAVSGSYAVHRVDLARSRLGISVSGEELAEPPLARFRAAPGMAFFRVGSKIVGVTGKNVGAVDAEAVVIDAGTWEVSPAPPPSSTTRGLVAMSSKIYAADMAAEDPRCEVLGSTSDAGASSSWSWSPLPPPPFCGRVLSLAAYPPRRGLLVSTEKDGTYLFDRRRRGGAAWVALSGSAAPPLEEGAVYAKDHDLWFEVSPRDGRLLAHDLDVVLAADEPRVEHKAHGVSDPVPVIAPSAHGGEAATASGARLVYLGSGKFCVAQAAADDAAGGAGRAVTVTVFRAVAEAGGLAGALAPP